MGADPATLMAIGSILGGGAAVASATGMFGGGEEKAATATPAVSTPTVMPTPDDAAAKRAKQRTATALQQRKGRQSTILSEPVSTDLLGG